MNPFDDKQYMDGLEFFTKLKTAQAIRPPKVDSVKITAKSTKVATVPENQVKALGKPRTNVSPAKGKELQKTALVAGLWKATTSLGSSAKKVREGLKGFAEAGEKAAPKIRKYDTEAVAQRIFDSPKFKGTMEEARAKAVAASPGSRIAHLKKEKKRLSEEGMAARQARDAEPGGINPMSHWRKRKHQKASIELGKKRSAIEAKLQRHLARTEGSASRKKSVEAAKEEAAATLKEGLKGVAKGAVIPAAGLYGGKKILDTVTGSKEQQQYPTYT